ncbi:hypothetical protein ATE92_1537 [Ulvibacter sp. MAR_2010_11]|uniref:hypothetical protein n=1 Tax=Ulvibacter sp. MAR_2010_11 TaxID=1250229 RepID=UPI000CAAB197|nr:hypothetical protein [Ulvibacter sp. MAR_2010_11]PKA83385.1 hypothetical protein ATE92_1537 [Ulvibacter sp. MAR_2010_11]
MKKVLIYNYLIVSVFLFSVSFMIGQVGINTTTPNGALDVNTTDRGIVFPVVSLPDLTTQTIVNPNGGSIVAGTTVFNTNTTVNGTNSVYPGIYFWNGTMWVAQREKKDNKLFLQNANLRTGSDDFTNGVFGDQSISFTTSTFTPIYSGLYRVSITVHYGGGNTDLPSSPQFTNFAKEGGVFDFTFNGIETSFAVNSYSGSNDDNLFDGGSLKRYTNSMNQTNYDIEETLVAGTNYPFTLTFNQADAQGFEGNGDISISPAGDGRGYITINGSVKCAVEINYIGE